MAVVANRKDWADPDAFRVRCSSVAAKNGFIDGRAASYTPLVRGIRDTVSTEHQICGYLLSLI